MIKTYFQAKIIDIGNYILIYLFNKVLFIKKIILKKDTIFYKYNNKYSNDIFLNFKLMKIINILENKLGNEIKLPDDIIFKIRTKLNIIKQKKIF